MDAVLGLSVTPSAVGVVLVEGPDAEGNTVDHDAFEIVCGRRSTPLQRSDEAAAAVLQTEALAADRGQRLQCIGVTWSEDAHAEASLLLKSLQDCGFDNVLPVRLPEASEALAWGIADVIGHDITAVCVLETHTAIALIVHGRDGAVQTAVNHGIGSEEALIRWLSAVFSRADWPPEALVMVGAGSGIDELMPRLEGVLSVPVFAPAESELALARGAALASAHHTEFGLGHFEGSDGHVPRHRRRPAQTGPLAMLVAGTVTFVVSLSIAVSLHLAPTDVAPAEQRTAAESAPEAAIALDPVPSAPAPPAPPPPPPPPPPPAPPLPPPA